MTAAVFVLLALSASAIVLPDTKVFYPSECLSTTNLRERRCCPNNCGGDHRGTCEIVTSSTCDVDSDWAFGPPDDQTVARRAFWFTRYFDRVCACKGNFWGAACEQCKWGWTGSACQARTPVLVRKAFHTLTSAEKNQLREAMIRVRDTPAPGYATRSTMEVLALGHSLAAGAPYTVNATSLDDIYYLFAHNGTNFATWHRHHMLVYERALQQAVNNHSLALPYWDWTHYPAPSDPVPSWFGETVTPTKDDPKGCLCMNSINPDSWGCTDGDDPRLPSDNGGGVWPCGCPLEGSFGGRFKTFSLAGPEYTGWPIMRAYGCMLPAEYRFLPTKAQVEWTVQQEEFTPWKDGQWLDKVQEGFTGQLESGIHAIPHIWVGATFVMAPWSASDPLFYLHHTTIDMITERWFRTHRESFSPPNDISKWRVSPITGAIPGHNLNDCLGGFFPLVSAIPYFSTSEEHGYTYDVFDDSESGWWRQSQPVQSVHDHVVG